MGDEPPVDGLRRPIIPRKPVGGYKNTLTVPAFHSTRRGALNDDGVSEISQFSSDLTPYRGDTWNPNYSDSRHHGIDSSQHLENDIRTDIGDLGIPLVEVNAHEAEYRQQPHVPSHAASLAYASDQEVSFIQEEKEEKSRYWLPKALRWQFMVFLFILTLALGLLTLGLTIQSEKDHGLGRVHNTSRFLFRWRFTPTLITVIYTLFLTAMVNDIKRTEVFARLSRQNPRSASSTLFYKPRSFWFDTFDSMNKQRNNGSRNWILFWASLVNTVALLIIPPFSAALLSPAQVLIGKDISFSQVTPPDGPINVTVDDSIFFHTISGILSNTSTSIWLRNDYVVLPFSPQDQKKIPFSSTFSNSGEWTANTTVYQSGLDCQTMELQSLSNFTYSAYNTASKKIPRLNMTSFVLKSSDGCSLGLASKPADGASDTIWESGGGWWAGAPDFSYPLLWSPNTGNYSDMSASNSILLNTSSECGGRSMFFLATPYVLGKQFQAQGHICTSNYYQASLPVTVSGHGLSSSVDFDEDLFSRTKVPLSSSTLNVTAFEETFLSQVWSSKFYPPDISTIPDQNIPPKIGGPLMLVGAQNDFDLRSMITSSALTDQARQVKQRFFAESMQAAFQKTGLQQSKSIAGNITASEQKIVVSFVVGMLLTVVFLITALMILLVAIHTRLHNRPLNLLQNPATAAAVASMIGSEPTTRILFEDLDQSSETAMLQQLDGYMFSLRNGVLYTYDSKEIFHQSDEIPQQVNPADWRPNVLHGWFLAVFLVSFAILMTVLAILYGKFHHSAIHQYTLVSSWDTSSRNRSLGTLAPYSIIPTLIAISVKLSWTPIDETFRRLQPYVSMASASPQNPSVSTLSYINSPLGWVVFKAATYRHWPLALVAFGAVLSEVFIVGMSGIWERNTNFRSLNQAFPRSMELRTVPTIFSLTSSSASGDEESIINQNSEAALSKLYGNLLTGWMYSSIIEDSNPKPWTNQGWSFVPVDLTSVPDSSDRSSLSKRDDSSASPGPANNITFNTPSLRARLQCSLIDMSNTSAWLTTLDFTDRSTWNNSNIPADLKVGYELKLGMTMETTINGTTTYYGDSSPYFSFFSIDSRLNCCSNETDGTVGEAAIGYWSAPADAEHTGIIVKWITGHPFATQFNESGGTYYHMPAAQYRNRVHWVFKDIPKITALNCTPIFETADASVIVDRSTGIVQDYSILSPPTPDTNAWSNKYTEHNVSTGLNYLQQGDQGWGVETQSGTLIHNVSVSYGYLFHDALLGAANSARTGETEWTAAIESENLDDRIYNFRLPGLNLDFMSYASLALVNNNNSALLDPNILADISSKVFSTFFTNFVQSDVDTNTKEGIYMNGSWILQPRGATLPSDLGPAIPSHTKRELQNSSSTAITGGIVNAIISTQIEEITLNKSVTILCICILIFLFLITLAILSLHKSYIRNLPRDVSTLGSVLGFIYASEKLLSIASKEGRGLKGPLGKKEVARMGWFIGGGKRRWGVEIVEANRGSVGGVDWTRLVDTERGKRFGGYVKIRVEEGGLGIPEVPKSPGKGGVAGIGIAR